MQNTSLPDYDKSVVWVHSVLKSYNNSGTMLTEDNAHTLQGDWEPEDTHDLYQSVIVPDQPWYLQLGNRKFQVLAIYLNTEHNWCNWGLSMVSQDGRPTWHPLDLRVLAEPDYENS